MAAVSRQQVRAVVEPAVTGIGYDVEDVTVETAGRRRLVRIVVDRDGGIDLDAVADVSRAVSAALDADDLLGGTAYTLEVTSPGVDRPLTDPRHWRRAAGRLVRVTLTGGETLTGRVRGADDAAVTLDVDGDVRTLAHTELGPGHVQVEFGRGEPS